jgi:CheY-like chemotaxis protein
MVKEDHRWKEIDDRSRLCYEDIESLGAELRELAAGVVNGYGGGRGHGNGVPMTLIGEDDSVVVKARHLRERLPEAPTVLFVDDEENNRKAFEYAFGEQFKIFTAANGVEALDLLDRERISVLVADQKMPGMTGVELCKIVKGRFPGVVRMIISAYVSTEAVMEACNEAQVRCFVRKPWEHERLVRMLNEALVPDAQAMTIVG